MSSWAFLSFDCWGHKSVIQKYTLLPHPKRWTMKSLFSPIVMHKLIVLCGKIVFMKLLPRGCIMLILKQSSCIDSSCAYARNTTGVGVCRHLGWLGGKKSSSVKQWPRMLNSWWLQSRKLPLSVIQRIIPGSRLLEGEEAGGDTSEKGDYNSANEGWEDHHLFCKLTAVTKWPGHSSMLETLLQAMGQLHTVIQRPRFSICGSSIPDLTISSIQPADDEDLKGS